MNENLPLKFKIKQHIDKYNKNQKMLYINSYILKIVTIISFLVILVIIAIFFMPFLTPLMLKSKVMGPAIGITFSGCFISIIVVMSIVFFFIQRKELKRKQQEESIQNLLKDTEIKKDYENITPEIQTIKPIKRPFLLRLLNIFSIVKEIFLIFLSLFYNPITNPNYIYLDETRLKFTFWLIEELIKDDNCTLNSKYVLEKYSDYSNTWVINTLDYLNKAEIINTTTLENGENIILLNLDFYKPE